MPYVSKTHIDHSVAWRQTSDPSTFLYSAWVQFDVQATFNDSFTEVTCEVLRDSIKVVMDSGTVDWGWWVDDTGWGMDTPKFFPDMLGFCWIDARKLPSNPVLMDNEYRKFIINWNNNRNMDIETSRPYWGLNKKQSWFLLNSYPGVPIGIENYPYTPVGYLDPYGTDEGGAKFAVLRYNLWLEQFFGTPPSGNNPPNNVFLTTYYASGQRRQRPRYAVVDQTFCDKYNKVGSYTYNYYRPAMKHTFKINGLKDNIPIMRAIKYYNHHWDPNNPVQTALTWDDWGFSLDLPDLTKNLIDYYPPAVRKSSKWQSCNRFGESNRVGSYKIRKGKTWRDLLNNISEQGNQTVYKRKSGSWKRAEWTGENANVD